VNERAFCVVPGRSEDFARCVFRCSWRDRASKLEGPEDHRHGVVEAWVPAKRPSGHTRRLDEGPQRRAGVCREGLEGAQCWRMSACVGAWLRGARNFFFVNMHIVNEKILKLF
jgi:hypothetical protein